MIEMVAFVLLIMIFFITLVVNIRLEIKKFMEFKHKQEESDVEFEKRYAELLKLADDYQSLNETLQRSKKILKFYIKKEE